MSSSSLDPLIVDSYDYKLPQNLIATTPSNPKDSAKLLIYDRKKDKITHAIFKDILDFIPNECAIFLNDTKVIKARIFGEKPSGGKIELLLNSPLQDNRFLVYIKGRVKEGLELLFDENLKAKIERLNSDGTRVVKFFKDQKELSFEELNSVLEKIGHIPLPPYINREDNKDDESDYQSLFAKQLGAVAAPTASLHFTKELLKKMQESFDSYYVTLHVGAGTFKPVTAKSIKDHKMHEEIFHIPPSSKDVILSDKAILAVGTTVTRTIEYFARTKKESGKSDLFLHPQNRPLRVDHLLTNFHLPKSTLLMLVASFVGIEKTLKLYEEAIKKDYRFYSYGDAMLIL
ncbi:MAG: tRNA preQ1(34) S-adenosylmethionine ribosyltransferase-isomerase QueA [Sulfurospirillum sp.]|nr:MAG: tRNA preQ1(34) S-adenosylmethionine ribosyltransferase-isomerase QueA [Sulfurospirillum sp.]